MAIKPEIIRHIPFFADLTEDDVRRVAQATIERRYERGEIILLEGEHGGALYFVREGLVKIFKTSPEGKEQVLRLIASGHTFNDVPALDDGPNPASAAAMEPSVVYLIEGTALRRLMVERPAVAAATVKTLAVALRHLVALVEDLSFRRVTARVAKILLEQEKQEEAQDAQQAKQPPSHRLTQQEMAAMAGTAREVVGRALKELEAAGAIQLRRGHIRVISRERLRLLA